MDQIAHSPIECQGEAGQEGGGTGRKKAAEAPPMSQPGYPWCSWRAKGRVLSCPVTHGKNCLRLPSQEP